MHPYIQPDDIVKMCYQTSFGMEHLTDERMKEYLFKEFEISEHSDIRIEEISEDFCRINLGGWPYSKELLWEIFENSKGYASDISFEQLMNDYLETLKSVWDEHKMKEMHSFLTKYYSKGIIPIHHSKIYTEHEKPHYRLVRISVLKEKLNANNLDV